MNNIKAQIIKKIIEINQTSQISLPPNCWKIDFSSDNFDIHFKDFSDNYNLLNYSFFNLINLTKKLVIN